MLKVRLEFLPSLAESLGVPQVIEEDVPDSGELLIDLLNRLGSRYPLFSQIVFDVHTQTQIGRVAVFLNGRSVDLASRLATKLSDGDKLIFAQIIEGG
jgi:molybdopterin converting factor small subunit